MNPTTPAVNIISPDELTERIIQARSNLAAYFPFYGQLVYSLTFIPEGAERLGIQTAAVAPDGSLYVNRAYASKLTPEEMRGLLAHEVSHPAMFFFQRVGSRRLRQFNRAHDYVINLLIDDYIKCSAIEANSRKLALPPGGLLDRKYEGLSAEEIYDRLTDEDSSKVKKTGSSAGNEFDESDESSLDGDCRPDLNATDRGKQAARGDKASTQELEEKWKQTFLSAVMRHEQMKQRGTLPGSLQKLVDKLLNPIITWQDYLLNYLGGALGGADLTYMRPHRRSEAVGERLAGTRRREAPDLTILWDTSGSMNGLEERILSEIQGLVEEMHLKVRVIVIDTIIHADVPDIGDAMDLIPHITGGGGSDFTPAFTLLEQESDTSVVLAFTDGYIGVPAVKPDQLQDVMWILIESRQRPANWGRAISIDRNSEAVTVL